MRTNDLCTLSENRRGFSAFYLNFSINIYYKGNKIGEVCTEEELHQSIGDDWWFGDTSTYGSK